MKKLRIAFDIDDTLIVPSVATGLPIDTPNYENIAIYKFFQAQGHHMILWSGSGMDWARTWGEKLGLQPDEVRVKKKTYSFMGDGVESHECHSECDYPFVDICFDDCDVDLAKVNVKVKRINNNISREEWNKEKR